MKTTSDMRQLLIDKFSRGEFRVTASGIKTVEIRDAQFVCDKDYIIREPNYEYAKREIEWYESQSLNVNDIPGKVPAIWQQCADVNGEINSNYGWMIYSKENGSQFNNCLWQLKNDPATREAVMIYNRPNMHTDAVLNHKKDFCCTYAVQCFLNPRGSGYELSYTVYMRSNDAVFGFDNDVLWHKHVQRKLGNALAEHYDKPIILNDIVWHAGSLHVYERHFKYLQ